MDPTKEKVLDATRAARYEQWSRDFVGRAILDLAQSAALSERSSEFTDAPTDAEHHLWFVVRALCAQYEVPYEAMVRRGRERAAARS